MSMAVKPKQVVMVIGGNCPIDLMLAGIATFLLVYGLVMVGSASLEVGVATHGNAFHLINRHMFYLGIGAVAAVLTLVTPISIWQRCDLWLLALSFLLLLIVLVPGVGREVNGSTRWIPIGPFGLQGSEFAKLFLLVYVAAYLVRRKEDIESSFFAFVKPLLILTVISLLLLAQPDFGAAIVILGASIGMIFLAGVPYRYFLPVVVISISAVSILATLEPYRLARLTAFANPWENQFGSGYQLTQALIAFGRGEWFGLGLGNSIQKLFFLPEAHTDFLFSIIAEELGVIGAGLIIVLFACLVLRGLAIGLEAKQKGLNFHAHLAFGIAMILGLQASINLGVNLGILPTKGLTLPLMSYGGNSLIVSCIMVAILLRVDFEARQVQVEKSRGDAYG